MKAAAKCGEKVVMIGLRPEEDEWVRLLVSLLRKPDPVVAELTRQAMLYLEDAAMRRDTPTATQG